MDYKKKTYRNRIIIVVIVFLFLFGCGSLIGYTNIIKGIFFSLPALILLPIGLYFLITRFDGRKQFYFTAIWYGFIFAITGIIGMLIDERAYPLDWKYILTFAGIVWLLISLFVIIIAPIYSKIFSLFK